MKGTVKFFNETKAYGFISGEDNKEYFVHISGLNDGVSIDKGDSVTFKVEEGDRGPKATNVSKDEGGSEESSDQSEPEEENQEEF